MGAFKPFVFGTLLGAGLVFVGLQYHVVQSRDGFRVVPRSPQHALGLAYVDVRQWDPAQYADRPELVRALVEHGSTDLVADSVASGVIQSVASGDGDGSLDHLRSFLDPASQVPGESTHGGEAGFFDSSDSLKLPSPEGLNFDDDLDFSIPFPQEARGIRNTIETARRNASRPADDVRTMAPIDDVFNAGPGRLQPLQNQRHASHLPQPSDIQPSSSHDDDALERMLFGDDDTPRDLGEISGDSEPFGMFEEVTSSLENNAARALRGVGSAGTRSTSQRPVRGPAGSLDRYVRDSVQQLAPDSMESLKRTYGQRLEAARDSQLPPELRAVPNGFDPFAE